ncbi:MAG: hypothetical protein P4L45_08915 [Ignavibacteriaceae bacterium]|nr:hypothetical protein [Ignavibacteriaceae bacterium]
MGMEIKKKTSNTYLAYLTLGLLEINKEDRSNEPVSQAKILDELRQIDIPANNYVGRSVAKVNRWLKDAEFRNDHIFSRGRKGFKLNENLPSSVYGDILGAFLHLTLIEDKKHTDNLYDLLFKEGERPLSVITKLVLAKRNHLISKVKYKEINTELEFSFEPAYFRLDNNEWIVVGNEGHLEKKLLLSNILRVTLPEQLY